MTTSGSFFSFSPGAGYELKGSIPIALVLYLEPAQLKHKKSALEEYIDSLDDYVQKEWASPSK